MKLNDFGKVLVDQCTRIDMKDFLASAKGKVKVTLLKSEIIGAGYVLDLEVTKIYRGGERFWFRCPNCKTRRAILYQHPLSLAIGCRDCLNLDYRKRRYKGMIEASVLKS